MSVARGGTKLTGALLPRTRRTRGPGATA